MKKLDLSNPLVQDALKNYLEIEESDCTDSMMQKELDIIHACDIRKSYEEQFLPYRTEMADSYNQSVEQIEAGIEKFKDSCPEISELCRVVLEKGKAIYAELAAVETLEDYEVAFNNSVEYFLWTMNELRALFGMPAFEYQAA